MESHGVTMRSLKILLGGKVPSTTVVDPRPFSQRVLTEYVLNMAVTALAHGDIAPLYEQYTQDSRLSEEDKEELARAYLLLQMAPLQGPTPD